MIQYTFIATTEFFSIPKVDFVRALRQVTGMSLYDAVINVWDKLKETNSCGYVSAVQLNSEALIRLNRIGLRCEEVLAPSEQLVLTGGNSEARANALFIVSKLMAAGVERGAALGAVEMLWKQSANAALDSVEALMNKLKRPA